MKYLLLLLILLASTARAAPLICSQDMGNHIAVNGSTTPAVAQFDVAPSSSYTTGAYVLTISSANRTTVLLGVTASGHVGGLGAAPALSSCGTSTLDSNATDQDGKVAVVGTALTACTITFAIPYTTYEHCIAVSDNTAFVAAVTSQSTTSITVSFTVAINSGSFVYECHGL